MTMHILIDTINGTIAGFVNDASYPTNLGQAIIPAPEGFSSERADEWAFVGGALMQDASVALSRAKATRIAAIKSEAARYLEASAWKLERAREREQAGWGQVADVTVVLAEREAVRRSSGEAESAVMALNDATAVTAFAWSPTDVVVPAPRLLTHERFIQRFTDAEWQVMTGAARGNAAMDAWMRRFSLATIINLDDPATAAGVHALEMAGILTTGRASEILGATAP